jgi:hypothetical protein
MDDAMGPFSLERAWNAVDGWQVCRIVWTTEPLRESVSSEGKIGPVRQERYDTLV